MQLEINRLDLRYSGLRLLREAQQARLCASLAREGQQLPVLVIPDVDDRYVLIDGYRRVEALQRIGCDLVEASVLELTVEEALLMHFHFEKGKRRTALEDAWLLRELVEVHGWKQHRIAAGLRRTKSWVSSRLGLLKALPESVQDKVRSGQICAQAAMKFLVPMARTDRAHCERMVENLKREEVTLRQVERLYRAWRGGDPEQRERIVSDPLLFIKTDEAVNPPNETWEHEPGDRLAEDLEVIASMCRRARKRLQDSAFARANTQTRTRVHSGWQQACGAFKLLQIMIRKEELDAGPRHAKEHLQATR